MSVRQKLNEHVSEVLKMSGQQRYSGSVIAIDDPGTTAWIQYGERVFLAFTHRKPVHGNTTLALRIGDQVSFWVDGMRAKGVEIIEVLEEAT